MNGRLRLDASSIASCLLERSSSEQSLPESVPLVRHMGALTLIYRHRSQVLK